MVGLGVLLSIAAVGQAHTPIVQTGAAAKVLWNSNSQAREKSEPFAATNDGDPLPFEVDFGRPSPKDVTTNNRDASPKWCLSLSPQTVIAGESVTLKATVSPVQTHDTEATVYLRHLRPFLDLDDETSIKIPAGKGESDPLTIKTHWDESHDLNWVWGYMLGKPSPTYVHDRLSVPFLDGFDP